MQRELCHAAFSGYSTDTRNRDEFRERLLGWIAVVLEKNDLLLMSVSCPRLWRLGAEAVLQIRATANQMDMAMTEARTEAAEAPTATPPSHPSRRRRRRGRLSGRRPSRIPSIIVVRGHCCVAALSI